MGAGQRVGADRRLPSLTKPSRPKEAIVRMIFKETVVNLEVKKPAGKWGEFYGQPYAKVQIDPDTELRTVSASNHTELHRADAGQQGPPDVRPDDRDGEVLVAHLRRAWRAA